MTTTREGFGQVSNRHTPGPWRWEINEKHKTMQLVGGDPKYDLTVMGFKRWGMQDAAATLREPDVDGMNIMHHCTHWARPVAGREHHAHWFKTIDHPDARLIAAAPELLAALEAIFADDYSAPHDANDTDISREKGLLIMRMRRIAGAAIAAAKGGA